MNQSTCNYHFKAGETITNNKEMFQVFADALALTAETANWTHFYPESR